MKWLVGCYWILFCVATVGLSADGPSFPWQAVLVILWLAVWRFRMRIRRYLFGRGGDLEQTSPEFRTGSDAHLSPPSSPPLWVWYFGLGLPYATIIGENLGVGFEGDIHPNLAINTLLWVGSYLGLLAGWWILGRRYLWSAWQIYWLSGLMGVVIEQDYLVPRILASEQAIEAVVIAPFVHAVYGSIVAPIFAILGQDLPASDRRPGIGAKVMAVVLPAVLFFVGGSWILLWFWLVPSWRM